MMKWRKTEETEKLKDGAEYCYIKRNDENSV